MSNLTEEQRAWNALADEMVEKTFEGSLPAFLAAFTRRRRLSDGEINAMQAMIDAYPKENGHD